MDHDDSSLVNHCCVSSNIITSIIYEFNIAEKNNDRSLKVQCNIPVTVEFQLWQDNCLLKFS